MADAVKTNVADALIQWIQEHREEINALGWGFIRVYVFRHGVERIRLTKEYKS